MQVVGDHRSPASCCSLVFAGRRGEPDSVRLRWACVERYRVFTDLQLIPLRRDDADLSLTQRLCGGANTSATVRVALRVMCRSPVSVGVSTAELRASVGCPMQGQ